MITIFVIYCVIAVITMVVSAIQAGKDAAQHKITTRQFDQWLRPNSVATFYDGLIWPIILIAILTERQVLRNKIDTLPASATVKLQRPGSK